MLKLILDWLETVMNAKVISLSDICLAGLLLAISLIVSIGVVRDQALVYWEEDGVTYAFTFRLRKEIVSIDD